MIEWIQILEVLAVVMASLGAAMFFVVFIKLILNIIPKRKATPKIQKKEQKENITMSKEAREGVTFNDIFIEIRSSTNNIKSLNIRIIHPYFSPS